MKDDLACTNISSYIQYKAALDLIWLEMTLVNNDKLLLGCVYRSPNSTDVENEQLNMELKAAVQRGYSHILITGDFNYPEINWDTYNTHYSEDHRSSQFLECVNDCFLSQNVSFPTHHRVTQSANILDLVFTNEETMIEC